MKILLVGNPNVGKSVVFTRLTGVDVIASNYPGTTVGFTEGKLKLDKEFADVVDVPGIYSLEAASKAEEVAVKMLEEGDVIINVIDSTNIERNLNLTLQLVRMGKPMLVILNFWDETHHRGIHIDVEKLEKLLGVPCITACAVSGEGINHIVTRLAEAKVSSFKYNEKERFHEVGNIVSSVQNLEHRHHTLMDRLGELTVMPFTGIPFAVFVMALTFVVIRFIGEGLITRVFDPLFEKIWAPLVMKLSGVLGSTGFIHDILIGKLTDGGIDFVQSFGLITTGLYVPVAMVLPYILSFYLILSVLEDMGYLPRLAVLVDNLMHRLGLHGLAIVPMFLSFGCNVPGIMATRILESRKQRFICVALMCICVPCMSQSAMIISLLGKHGISGLGMVFLTLFIVWTLLGFILKKLIKEETPEIFVEIPSYRLPHMGALIKKLWMRLRWFLKEAIPFVILGVFVMNILYTLGIIDFIGSLMQPVVTGILGLPKEAVMSMLIGFLRKDVAVGMLVPLGLSLKQLIIASVVLTMYFPCIASFVVLFKELGLKDMIKAALLMIFTSLFVGGILNIIL